MFHNSSRSSRDKWGFYNELRRCNVEFAFTLVTLRFSSSAEQFKSGYRGNSTGNKPGCFHFVCKANVTSQT